MAKDDEPIALDSYGETGVGQSDQAREKNGQDKNSPSAGNGGKRCMTMEGGLGNLSERTEEDCRVHTLPNVMMRRNRKQ